MVSAFDLVRRKLEDHGCQVKGSGRELSAQCPAHEDRNPSLSVTNGNSRVLVRCHAGCDIDDVLAALGLSRSDLFDEDKKVAVEHEHVAMYEYVDETGNLLFQVLRTPGKQFRQRVPDPAAKDGWKWRLGETRRVLYRLPAVIEAANAGRDIWIAEGEKDVHALEAAGVTATCNPGGAGKWRPEFSDALAGAVITIVADRDKPGQAHARMVARALTGAASVRIVEAAEGKDAHDHLAAGRSLDEFTVTHAEGEASKPDLAEDLHDFLARADDAPRWVIPGVLERGDRFMITGGEGRGKSLFSRQIAICAAAGIHPFTIARIARQRVLYIDCENSERFSRKHFRRLAGIAASQVDRSTGERLEVPRGGLRLIHRPEGLDLHHEDDAWLLERVTAHEPDLLVIGPLYRLHVVDANEETAARAIVNAIDAARLAADCAVIIEAHSPHEESGRKRALRPAGSSLFRRWPELGYGIRAKGSEDEWDRDHVAGLEQWRGPRDERPLMPRWISWGDPDMLEFPWVRHEEGNMING